MFDAPTIIKQIPDIKQIYDLNDTQANDLEKSLEDLEHNIFLDTMSEELTEKWEKIFEIKQKDDDSLKERRFRVKSKILEKLPYSYRVIMRRLEALCPLGFTMQINEERTEIVLKLNLSSKKMYDDAAELIEEMIPLSMTVDCMIMYNQHRTLAEYPHRVLSWFTYKELHDTNIERSLSKKVETWQTHKTEDIECCSVNLLERYGLRKP